MNLELFVKDLRTYQILSHNNNYRERLLEAYYDIKVNGINNVEMFISPNNPSKVGAFTFDEITIFDRIKDEKYLSFLETAWFDIHNETESYIKDQSIGDKLASWGTLGNTPYRDEYIEKGLITHGLTEEETNRRF